MFKPILLFTISFFIGQVVYAQTNVSQNDTAAYYMNIYGWIAANKADAAFIRVLISPHNKDPKDQNSLYNVSDFYLNGKVKLAATTSWFNANQVERGFEGPSVEYFENGHKKCVKQYKSGKLKDEAVYYYPNGNVYKIENYNDKSNVYLKECRDSTGGILTENGNGRWIKYADDNKKNIYEEGQVVDGKEDGEWKAPGINGAEVIAVYKNGELISDKYNSDEVSTQAELPPSFEGGIEAFSRFIASNIHYPVYERDHGIQGRVFLSFIVEKDGSITNVKVIRGVGGRIDEEAMRVIKMSPKWRPGMQKGKPVRVIFNVPVSFALSEG